MMRHSPIRVKFTALRYSQYKSGILDAYTGYFPRQLPRLLISHWDKFFSCR